MGRPAVVPPAGRGGGGLGASLPGRWGKVGRFLRKHRGWCGPRGLVPYREVGGPGGPRRRVRLGDAGSGDPAFRVTLRVGGAL